MSVLLFFMIKTMSLVDRCCAFTLEDSRQRLCFITWIRPLIRVIIALSMIQILLVKLSESRISWYLVRRISGVVGFRVTINLFFLWFLWLWRLGSLWLIDHIKFILLVWYFYSISLWLFFVGSFLVFILFLFFLIFILFLLNFIQFHTIITLCWTINNWQSLVDLFLLSRDCFCWLWTLNSLFLLFWRLIDLFTDTKIARI